MGHGVESHGMGVHVAEDRIAQLQLSLTLLLVKSRCLLRRLFLCTLVPPPCLAKLFELCLWGSKKNKDGKMKVSVKGEKSRLRIAINKSNVGRVRHACLLRVFFLDFAGVAPLPDG